MVLMKWPVVIVTSALAVMNSAFSEIEQQPFLFRVSRDARVAITTFHEPQTDISISLDDGTRGTLSIRSLEQRIRGVNGGEDYGLVVRDHRGKVLGHAELVACYERFQLGTIDMLGGPGEEIAFISQEYHGSPTYEPVLTIFQLRSCGLVQILSTQIGSWRCFPSLYIDEVDIDITDKPAIVTFRRQWEVGSESSLAACEAKATETRLFLWSRKSAKYLQRSPSAKGAQPGAPVWSKRDSPDLSCFGSR